MAVAGELNFQHEIRRQYPSYTLLMENRERGITGQLSIPAL